MKGVQFEYYLENEKYFIVETQNLHLLFEEALQILKVPQFA